MAWIGLIAAFLALSVQVALGSGRALQQMAGGGQCPGPGAIQLVSLAELSGRLGSECQLNYEISATALTGTKCAYDSKPASRGWLQAEVWDLDNVGQAAGESVSQADPLLMVARGQQPQAQPLTPESFDFFPLSTAVDLRGSRLVSPYQQVVVQSNTSDAMGWGGTWRLSLKNAARTTEQPLIYKLRLQCLAAYPCRSPKLLPNGEPDAPCSSQGRCQPPSEDIEAELANVTAAAVGNGSSGKPVYEAQGKNSNAPDGAEDPETPAGVLPPRVCTCFTGFTDVGCDLPVAELVAGEVTSSSIPAGKWKYFNVPVPDRVGHLLVEMNRTAGEPLLFVKPEAAGVLPGGVPTALDYIDFSDSASFRQRLNFHSRSLLRPPGGIVQVAVYNSDFYLQEIASVSLQVRFTLKVLHPPAPKLAQSPPPSLCARNCTYNGTCTATDTCKCFQGFDGAQCQGPSNSIKINQAVRGFSLQPGNWAFWQLTLQPKAQWSKGHGLEFLFAASAGAPVLMAKRNGYPTLLDNDFVFRSSNGFQVAEKFKVPRDDLKPGVYTLAIFNMDYFAHSAFTYKLTVRPASAPKLELTPYFSIVIGVSVALMMCVAIAFIRRYIRAHRRRPANVEGVELPELPTFSRSRGLEPALVQSFPVHEYNKATALKTAEAAMPAGIAAPQPVALSDGVALPQHSAAAIAAAAGGRSDTEHSAATASLAECTVCLEEWENGDTLRTLPCCHFFHVSCIDKWLSRRGSCPICRASFMPASTRRGGSQRLQQGDWAESPVHGFGPIGLTDSDLPIRFSNRRRHGTHGHRHVTSASPAMSASSATSVPPVEAAEPAVEEQPGSIVSHAASPATSELRADTAVAVVEGRPGGNASDAACPAALHSPTLPGLGGTSRQLQRVEASDNQTASADHGGMILGSDSRVPAGSSSLVPAGEELLQGNVQSSAGLTGKLHVLSDSLARYWAAR